MVINVRFTQIYLGSKRLKKVANKSVKRKRGYLCAVEEKQSEIGVEIKELKIKSVECVVFFFR